MDCHNKEYQDKMSKINNSQYKLGVYDKISRKVRKFGINMLLTRKFVITKNYILLMLLSKKLQFFFRGLVEFLEQFNVLLK